MENFLWPTAGQSELHDDISTLVELLESKHIELLAEQGKYSKEELKAKYPGKNILVCDFEVDGADPRLSYAKQLEDGLMVIDHHADMEEMQRQISSTNLAIRYVVDNGPVPDDWVCVVNHSDTDAVLSSLIMKGILPPKEIFGAAAIAADHTGEGNEIADLMQAVKNERDIAYSLKQLQLLFDGKDLDERAAKLMQRRQGDREKIRESINQGKYEMIGDVASVILDEKIDAALVPALLPQAKLILLFSPMTDGKRAVDFRVGLAAPAGFSLKKLGIERVDDFFGGRWNAGGNWRSRGDRSGGTGMAPQDYARRISGLVDDWLRINH